MIYFWSSVQSDHYDRVNILLLAVEEYQIQSTKAAEEPDKILLDLRKLKEKSHILTEEEKGRRCNWDQIDMN